MSKSGLHYFKHDFNARNDAKLVNIHMKYGYEGIGIYWSLIEIIYEAGGSIELDYDLIAYNMRADKTILKFIVEDSNLFIVEDNKITNQRIEEDINSYKKKVELGIKSASKRWGNNNKPNGEPIKEPIEEPINTPITSREEKKREEKKREEKNREEASVMSDFDLLVSFFPDGKNRYSHHDLNAWDKLSDSDKKLAIEMAEPYIKNLQQKGEEQFIKSVSNYIKDFFWIEIRNKKSRYIGSTKTNEELTPEMKKNFQVWGVYFSVMKEKHPDQIKYEENLLNL